MKTMTPVLIALCFSAAAGFGLAAPGEADAAVHEELRNLLKVTREAVNSGKFEDLLPALSDQVRLTMSTQDFCGSGKEVSAYMAKTFGPGKKVKSLKLDWEPAVLTELSPDKSWGLAYGSGTEDYVLNDGRKYHFKIRWTSMVAKEADGKWRIRSMHMGSNYLDNPILDEVAMEAKRGATFAGFGGLFVGLLFGFMLGRRKS